MLNIIGGQVSCRKSQRLTKKAHLTMKSPFPSYCPYHYPVGVTWQQSRWQP